MTNSIDPQQAQRVWSRVMAAGCAAKPAAQAAPNTAAEPAAQAASEAPVQPAQAAATSPQEPAVPLRTQLRELLRRARADAAQYACLSRQLRGCARQTLARLADSSRQEARTLAALYYLETGQRAPCDAVSPERYACPAAALRRQHARQLARAEAYHALADATPAYAETLHCLADRATARAKALVAALRDCL